MLLGCLPPRVNYRNFCTQDVRRFCLKRGGGAVQMTSALVTSNPRTVSFSLLAIGLAVFMTPTRGGAIAIADPLFFDRGFLVTGNYVVGGADFTPQANP